MNIRADAKSSADGKEMMWHSVDIIIRRRTPHIYTVRSVESVKSIFQQTERRADACVLCLFGYPVNAMEYERNAALG